MTTAIQFLRSDRPGLRPNPVSLAEGMPMLNTNETESGLFFRARDNSLVKIGPAHVGQQAPNSSAQGFEGNSIGEMWLDTFNAATPTLKVWTGSEWKATVGASINPLTPGAYITGNVFDGGTADTWAVNATSLNTPDTVVARDSSGGFVAGAITGTAINGSILNLTGLLEGTSAEFTGSVAIGGDVSTNPNISLNTDGSASFRNAIDLLDDGVVRIRDEADNAVVAIELSADGTGTFGGLVESQSGGFRFPDGTIQTTAGAGGSGGTLQSVTDAGSTTTNDITVSAIITSNRTAATNRGIVTQVNGSTGAIIYAGGDIDCQKVTSNRSTSTDRVLSGQLNDTETSNIKADGSATFAGAVTTPILDTYKQPEVVVALLTLVPVLMN